MANRRGKCKKCRLLFSWPLEAKSWLIRKDPDAGKDWRQEEKGETEDEMVGWHQQLNGHEFEQASGDGKGRKPGVLQSMGPNIQTWLNNWTTTIIFLGSEITVDTNYSHKIKRHLLLGRKALTNLDSVLKNRDITLLTKVHIVKALIFPAVMYGCESWTTKKAECQKNDAFELWCWRRLLRLPWTAKRSNQSILKEINPECSLQRLMLKLKPQ